MDPPAEKKRRCSFLLLWLTQFRLLMWKNWLIARRSKRALIIQILAPIVFVVLLLVIDRVVKANANNRKDDSEVVDYSKRTDIGKIPRCTVGRSLDSCYTFLYAPNNSAIVDSIIQAIIDENNIPRREVLGLHNATAVDNWIYRHQNMTPGAYLFDISNVNGTTLISYTVQTNETNQRYLGRFIEYPYYVQLPMFVSLQRQLFKYITNNPNLTFEVSALAYPHPEVDPIDVIGTAAPLFFFGAIMFNFVVAVSQIVTEKELMLRNSLNMMGLMDSVFWGSWFVLHIAFSTGSVFLIIITAAICQFDIILKNNFLTYFLALWFFALAMVSMGFLISTLFKKSRNATAVGFVIFISGFFLQLTSEFLYADGQSAGYKIAQYILALFAPVLLAKSLGDLATATLKQADNGLTAADILDYTSTFPLIVVYIFLMIDFVLYFLLALYLDNVLPDSRGLRKPLYYFLLPSYWGSGIKGSYTEAHADIPDKDTMDEDVYNEEMLVRNGEVAEDVVLQVCGLNKTYKGTRRGGWMRCCNCLSCRCCPRRLCGKKVPPFKAVADIWFSINANQLFCLLGPNGAGKTTTISMLTGQLPPTRGNALVYGFSILNQVPQIQRFMGVCPQFDVLWDKLTGKEHLQLYAGMKGIRGKNIKREATQKLKEVSLHWARNTPSEKYSGGMKRRLSVAMALIGDPKIVYLDEPTTGMDPVSRRQVWNIIEKAKKDRVVVLTTHSMEEADTLSDKIGIISSSRMPNTHTAFCLKAIMAFGKLQCIGPPVRLKNKYGTGYRITIGTSANNVQEIIDFFLEQLPGTVLETAPVSGYMTFDIPRDAMKDLPAFLEALESNKESLGIVDAQLSLTTLEEVFLKIVSEAEKKKQKEDEEAEGES